MTIVFWGGEKVISNSLLHLDSHSFLSCLFAILFAYFNTYFAYKGYTIHGLTGIKAVIANLAHSTLLPRKTMIWERDVVGGFLSPREFLI